jgi:hypothetical protein
MKLVIIRDINWGQEIKRSCLTKNRIREKRGMSEKKRKKCVVLMTLDGTDRDSKVVKG